METKKTSQFWTLVLYNGSTDERNQSLYDRAGYYSFVFLFIGIATIGLFKLFVFRVPTEQIVPELVLLTLSGVLLTFLCIRSGVTLFQNRTQKNRIRRLLFIVGFSLICAAAYIPLWLELPNAKYILSLGIYAWFVPPVVGLLGVSLVWGITRLTDYLGKRNSAKMEHQE